MGDSRLEGAKNGKNEIEDKQKHLEMGNPSNTSVRILKKKRKQALRSNLYLIRGLQREAWN